jgi:hypothetical protein
MKRLALALAVLLMTATFAIALDRSVTVTWTGPIYFATGTCDSQADPIPAAELATLQYQVKYRIGTGVERIATTASQSFVVSAAVGATVYAKVGAFLPGGSVLCWTDEVSMLVPMPSPGGCGNLKMEIK